MGEHRLGEHRLGERRLGEHRLGERRLGEAVAEGCVFVLCSGVKGFQAVPRRLFKADGTAL